MNTSPLAKYHRFFASSSSFGRFPVSLKMSVALLIAILCVTNSLLAADSAGKPPAQLKCESMHEPLGIDVTSLRLSWQLQDDRRGAAQTAYQIRVATSLAQLRQGNPLVWDSGRVASSESVNVVYGGPAVTSRQRYYWQVRVWDQDGKVGSYSAPSWWEMGLLSPADWKAKWIADHDPMGGTDYESEAKWIWGAEEDALTHAVPGVRLIRWQFTLTQKPQESMLLIGAKDNLQLWINGKPVLDSSDTTSPFRERTSWHFSRNISLAPYLEAGANTLAAQVTVDRPDKDVDTNAAGLIAVLRLKMVDGNIQRLFSGPSWKTARIAPADWFAKNFDDSKWQQVVVVAKLGEKPLGSPRSALSAAQLRREFQVAKTVRSARIYSSALGSYQLFLNGKRVGDDILAPGWTDYHKRVVYQTYDVTSMIQQKANVLGIILGGGWYGSTLGWTSLNYDFGPPPIRLLAQLEIEFSDSTREIISSDESWKASASPILLSEIYDGEDYDATLEQSGWTQTGFSDAKWRPVTIAATPAATLVAQDFQPIRVEKALTAQKITNPTRGVYVYDLGQNMVGWERLRVSGPKGTKIRLRFGEVLKPSGELYTDNLRAAAATDNYVLSGNGPETFEPHFTFHGFRYIEITGYPGTPGQDAVEGVVFHTDAPFSMKLSTGSSMVNQLWSNILWGQRGNFLSVPTDCPQRDERLGWMGDAQVFWRTASYNAELAAFSHKFATDMRDAQSPAGLYAVVSPRISMISEGAPGWADAGVIIPWTSYQQYRDRRILEENWDAMELWMKHLEFTNPNYLWLKVRGDDYGDWLAIGSETSKDLIATAYWAYDASLMQQMASVLGRKDDADKYQQLFEKIRIAFNAAYVKPDGTVGTSSQTSYVLALHMNLLPEPMRAVAATKLVDDIKANNGHLTTGFLGTPYLMFELTSSRHADVAYELLFNNTYPSWGYMVEHGATTMWERWNSDQMLADPGMNSFNHYAYGAVGEWLYREVAGIESEFADPGFHRIHLHPEFDAKLGSVIATYDSIYGPITSNWNVAGSKTTWKAVIPANTTAVFYLPTGGNARLFEGGMPLRNNSSLKLLREENGKSVYEAGAGTYNFRIEH
jgi:alpha-L-rhamnosidase